MTALSLATHTSRVALRLLAAGFVVAVLVLWAGRAIERSRFGATDADSVAEIEAQLRQRINAAADTLGVTSARIVSSRQLIQSASRDDASVRALFDALAVALPAEPSGRTGITVYSHPGVVPIAWAGRVSDLPKERIEGPAELFVAPRGRLIYVEPVTDPERPAAGRLGTIVVEQLLGDTSVAAPSDEAIVLETTLTPVTLRPALAATATRSPYIFLVPSRGGRVLLEAEVKSGDLAEARDGWRLLTRSAAWAVIGVTLLLGCGALLDIRRRAHDPRRMLLATAIVVVVMALARSIFWNAAGAMGPARGPIDLLLSGLFAAGVVWLLLDLVERRRVTSTRPGLVKEEPGSLARTVVVYVAAGVAGAAMLWTYGRFLSDIAAQAPFDLARLSLHPMVPGRIVTAFGLVLLDAAIVWTVALIFRVATVEWRLPRSSPLRALGTGSWVAGAVLTVIVASRISHAVPALPLLVPIAVAGVGALALGRPRGWARRASQAARLVTLFVALVAPALAMYPLLQAYATERKEQLIANDFGPQAASQREDLWRRRLPRAREQIDAMPALAELVTDAGEAPTADRAFLIWSQTELAKYRLTSGVELYGLNGRLVSSFALNLSEYTTALERAGACNDWDVIDEASPFGSNERHVLRATRSICQRGGPVGAIVVRAMYDYRDLPFIPAQSQSRYLDAFDPDRNADVEGVPGQDVEFIVYGWSKAPLYTSGSRVWPLRDELFARAVESRTTFWADVSRDGQAYRVYYLNDRWGIYALGYPVVTWVGHVVNLAEIATLTFALYILLIAGATLFNLLTAFAPASGRALVTELRSSFYRKLFLLFVLASVVPVGIFALATSTFFSAQLSAGVAEAAVNTATVAQRLVEDYAALQQQQGSRSLDLLDDQIMILVGQAINQDVDLFTGPRLQATSERDLYATGVLATRTPGDVYRQIRVERRPTFVGVEEVGGLQYQIAAAPVGRDGIVTVPQTLRRREIERQIDELNRRVRLGLVLFVMLGAGIGYWLAERIADPVNRLTRATRRIARGDLDARIAASSRDELSRLVEDFNRMAADLKRQRAELERTQRLEAWADMARQVAHDIKNPLTPIQLSAEHAQRLNQDRGGPLSPVLDDCIASILTQVKLLRQIAAEFSSFASSPTAHPETTDLAALVEEVVEPYRVGLAERIAIDVRSAPDLPQVSIDRTLFARALTNIIENALYAMPGRGRLTIVSRQEDTRVVVDVIDSGVGMDAEALSRIFEPYFSTKTSGTGLGLTIAKRNVELNGGTIAVESERGVGTTVRMTMPGS